jgi:hypothetical protein
MNNMKWQRIYMIPVFLWGLTVLYSCAAPKPKEHAPSAPLPPKAPPAAPVEQKPVTGMKGFVVLVDERGEVISYRGSASAVLSVKLARDGKPVEGKTSSINPEEDGSFFIALKEGTYSVEVFVKGFHVESFTVSVPRNEVIDVGTVTVKKFEAEGGRPAKGGSNEAPPLNEGDVNIQPPVS